MLYDMIQHNKNNSIVILDPKNEIYNLSSGFAKKYNFEVLTLSPLDINSSISFNPFEFVQYSGDLESIIRALVTSSNNSNQNTNDIFWRENAINLLVILARLLFAMPNKQYRNLPNLKYLLNEFDGTSNNILDNLFTKYCTSEVIDEYIRFKSYDDTVLLSIIATASMALSPIVNNDNLKKLLATNSFDFKTLRDKKVILYLNIPVHLADSYSFLVSNFINTMFQTAILNTLPSKKDNTITFLWDELGNYKIHKLDSYINITRGYKVSMVCFLQSIEQFENLFGKVKAQIILNSLNTKIYFGGTSLNTTNMLSNMIGKRHQNIQNRATLLPIMDSSEIRRLKDDEVLVFISNYRPVKLKVKAYYKNHKYKRASSIKTFKIPHRVIVDYIDYINLGGI
jgi:type IV secretion system protein VirD4